MRTLRAHLNRKANHGYAMIDLMIVMTLTIMLLSMCSIWIHKTMLYASTISQRASHTQNISRISRQLKTDTMLANSIENEDKSITIKGPGSHVIRYTIESNTITRSFAKKETTHVDKFTFADSAILTWNRSESPTWMQLDIGRDFSALSVDKQTANNRPDAQIRIGVPAKEQP